MASSQSQLADHQRGLTPQTRHLFIRFSFDSRWYILLKHLNACLQSLLLPPCFDTRFTSARCSRAWEEQDGHPSVWSGSIVSPALIPSTVLLSTQCFLQFACVSRLFLTMPFLVCLFGPAIKSRALWPTDQRDDITRRHIWGERPRVQSYSWAASCWQRGTCLPLMFYVQRSLSWFLIPDDEKSSIEYLLILYSKSIHHLVFIIFLLFPISMRSFDKFYHHSIWSLH